MYNREYTPERITELKPNEIFVFGSNLAGAHGGGAARLAYNRFGAIWGQGVGLQGQSYAIPTMQGGVETIKPYVDEFIEFAFKHREYKFLVTRIGCGIAAFTPNEIAPLFLKAIDLSNVILPKDFVEVMHRHHSVAGHSFHTWDPEKDFLEKYRALMEQVKRGDNDAYSKVKELRTKEFRNTVDIVNQGYYFTEEGEKRTFDLYYTDMVGDTVFYDNEVHVTDATPSNHPTIVEVLNMDCLDAVELLYKKGCHPALLNMASRRNPGGGVATGAGAQEETLFRRTNLFRSLYQFVPYAEQYGIKPSKHQYPLDKNYGGIYTPGVICFRESEQKGYALKDMPDNFSVITVAGMNHPDLTTDGKIADYHIEPIKNKIRTIFRLGLLHGHDALVLGALGCGAFRNPPRHVARLFHDVMDEPEFKNKYCRIIFAILDDHNSHRSHNPEGNYKPFAEEFSGMDKIPPISDEQKALMMWKMGLGNSAKLFNGENPMPEKTKVATKDSWKILDMPEENFTMLINEIIPKEVMQIIKYGHIPEAMEDHWFMYCDENTIRYYRSWTGFCIFIARFVQEDDGNYRIVELCINRDYKQYKAYHFESASDDGAKDLALFMALLTEEYGGDASEYWKKAF